MKDCTLLILTYKAKHHLQHLLPTIEEAVSNTPDYNCGVLIVDNGCSEETRQWSEKNFPEFNYVFSPVNDYLFSLNPFVKKLESKYVFILNDDMRMDKEALNRALPLLDESDKRFAVTCRIRDWDDQYTVTGSRMLHEDKGWLKSFYVNKEVDRPVTTLYAGGGAAVFRTELFNRLGGFDDLFRPAYCEDLALGHLAWLHGYEIIYQPAAVLFHREGGTIKDQFKKDQLEQAILKNRILWMISTGKGKAFLLKFFLMLPWRYLNSLRIHRNLFYAFNHSLSSIFKALKHRKKLRSSIFSNRDITKKLNKEIN